MRALLLVGLLGCATQPPARPIAPAAPVATPAREAWAVASQSPWPPEPMSDARAASLAEACSGTDGALTRIATELVAPDGESSLDPDELAIRLRMNGEPHVRARLVRASGKTLDDSALRARLAEEAGTNARCGVAFATSATGERMVAVVVDALADLDPLPLRARTGQWLTFAAQLHVPATKAKLVLLGPRGLPRTVPTARVGGDRVEARFALDRPGPFTVQLVADLASGPRPVLEARVFADVEPSTPDVVDRDDPRSDPTATLESYVRDLRAREALPALVRDRRLDALAAAHAESMRQAHFAAHDVGEGDLTTRFESAGLVARIVGENVARARSIGRAHRALEASPSHRMNLLRPDFTRVGLAVLSDGAQFYVCEVFASPLR